MGADGVLYLWTAMSADLQEWGLLRQLGVHEGGVNLTRVLTGDTEDSLVLGEMHQDGGDSPGDRGQHLADSMTR